LKIIVNYTAKRQEERQSGEGGVLFNDANSC